MSEKRHLRILSEEEKLRKLDWQEAFGWFSEKGDVQMCAMLSSVAPIELEVRKKKVTCYLEV